MHHHIGLEKPSGIRSLGCIVWGVLWCGTGDVVGVRNVYCVLCEWRTEDPCEVRNQVGKVVWGCV